MQNVQKRNIGHPVLTPEQHAENKENHQKLIKDIQRQHGKTMRAVQRCYGQNAQPMFFDKGQ